MRDVPFSVRYYDVVCVGSGGAGLVASLVASENRRVALISKGSLACGNTRIAAGNIAHMVVEDGDSPENFTENILKGGEYLGDRPSVARMVEDSSGLDRLMEEMGVVLERRPDGSLMRRGRGGHNLRRALAAMGGGVGISNALREQVLSRERIDVFEDTMAFKLLVADGVVRAVACYDLKRGELVFLIARAFVLATGGLGWLYFPHTTNVREATGDGFALALDAGLELVNMEQIQFQSFALVRPEAFVGLVCGEPIHGGPHGKVLDISGDVVLKSFSKMSRAQVCAQVARAIKQGRGTPDGGLILDLTGNRNIDNFDEYVSYFGGAGGHLDKVRRAYGPKAAAFEEAWEVAPSAHFAMGGVATDANCRTALPNLYAIGEVRGAIHGANRLGSVALMELFVCGATVGRRLGERAPDSDRGDSDATVRPLVDAAVSEFEESTSGGGGMGRLRPLQLMSRLQRTMWHMVGPIREESELRNAINEIRTLRDQGTSLPLDEKRGYDVQVVEALETRLMARTCLAVAASALERRETLGAHVREDYPERVGARPRPTVARLEGSEVVVRMGTVA